MKSLAQDWTLKKSDLAFDNQLIIFYNPYFSETDEEADYLSLTDW